MPRIALWSWYWASTALNHGKAANCCCPRRRSPYWRGKTYRSRSKASKDMKEYRRYEILLPRRFNVTVRRGRLTLRGEGVAGWQGETTIISIPHNPTPPHPQRESRDSQRTPAQRALAAGLRWKARTVLHQSSALEMPARQPSPRSAAA